MLVWIEKTTLQLSLEVLFLLLFFYTMPVKAEHCCGDRLLFEKPIKPAG